MKLEDTLNSLRKLHDAGTKTASETPAPNADVAAPDALKAALNAALAEPASTKTASDASSPVAEVMKIAQQLTAADDEASLKQAALMGAAFADAAVARFEQWNKVAAETAASAPAQTGFRSAVPEEQLKEAAEYGYKLAQEEFEKEAAAGQEYELQQLHGAATDEFLKAAAVTQLLLKQAAEEAK